jgi:hypothetical protein
MSVRLIPQSRIRQFGGFTLIALAACSSDPTATDNRPTTDLPIEWSIPVELADGRARIAVGGGGKVYVVGHSGPDCVVVRSDDYGATWERPVTIGPSSSNYPMQYGGIYADGMTVHLVTAETDLGLNTAPHLFYRQSTDGGATWSSAVQITAEGEQPRRANIVEEDGTIYVFAGRFTTAIEMQGALVFRSTDNGATWTSTVVGSEANNYGGSPWGLADGQNVHFVFVRRPSGDNPKAYYSKSMDGGDNWSTPVAIGDASRTAREGRPRIALSGGSLIACWTENPGDIIGVRSTDGGASWGTPFVFMPGVGAAAFGHQEVRGIGGGRFFMSAADENNNFDIWHIWSTDGGQTWTDPAFGFAVSGESSQLGGFDADDGWAHGITTNGKYSRRSLADMLTGGAQR